MKKMPPFSHNVLLLKKMRHAMSTSHKSVLDMVRNISDDESFSDELRNDIREQRIVKTLFAIRSARGVKQDQIAAILGVTQSRISKIENGVDSDLRFGEVEAYAEALNCEVSIAFMKRDSTSADRVKFHVSCIHQELQKMAGCVGEDKTLAGGVADFFGEAFFNIVHVLQKACAKLPKRDNQKPYIDIGICEIQEELKAECSSQNDPVDTTSRKRGLGQKEKTEHFSTKVESRNAPATK